jgi:hypothetical protein
MVYGIAQFVNNVWIESYDPTIEDSYRKPLEVDVRLMVLHPCQIVYLFALVPGSSSYPGNSRHCRN